MEKKAIFKKWWFWAIIAVFVIVVATAGGGEEASTETKTDSSSQQTQSAQEYVVVDLQKMLDDLNANALKAEKTYQNMYVEVQGKISNFDSDGSYISIEPVDADEWNFDTVTCNIENDEQESFLLEKSVGDTITIKGKITSIGELLGYTIKIKDVY